MKLELYNSPGQQAMDEGLLPEQQPEFLKHVPDFATMQALAGEYGAYQNVLVIAHGGSINPLYGFYHALRYTATKNAYFLNTVDPDYVHELKQTLKPDNTLVIAISKSGETTTQIELLMQFLDYPMLMITGKSSTLRAIGEKLGLTAFSAAKPDNGQARGHIVMHPPIGGRYTGLTEVTLLPALICGLDVQGLYKGAQPLYKDYKVDNLAWKAASVFWQLEQDGFVDVFMPFYAHNLFPTSAIIVQLCHESFCKAGRGQTYFAHEAPESQHHTNQRFFGGMKNIAGIFVGTDSFMHPTQNIFPPQTHSVQLKRHALFDINKIPLEKSQEFELQGTLEDARINGIPVAHISVSGFTAEEMGAFHAFWQLYAVYASVLRSVDPFDQPQVENSKNISFNKRLQYKGLL